MERWLNGPVHRLVMVSMMLLAAGSASCESLQQPGSILFVNSSPLGAEVAMDGRDLGGRTPLLLRDLEPGRHRLELRKQGFQARSLEIGLASGEAQVVAVDLPEQGISTSFPAEGEIVIEGKAEAAGDRIIYFGQGGFNIAREQGVVHVDPLYPQQRLIDALNITIPIMLVFATLLTVDAVSNPPATDWPVPPAVLASNGITLSMIGLDIGLNLHKRRQMRSYSYTARSAEANQQVARNLYAEAEQRLELGELEKALEGYAELMRIQPDSPLLPMSLYRIGSIRYLRGENADAVRSFESITRDYPVAELYDRCQKNLADLMLLVKQFEASLEHLDDMVFVDPLYSREEIAFYRYSVLEAWARADPSANARLQEYRKELIERYPDSPDAEAIRRKLQK
jgi:outer membrane protein assembly factor BamD (BamD/ComL family)